MLQNKKIVSLLAAGIMGALFPLLGCDQQDVEFPDQSQSASACGPWYVGGGEEDTGIVYGIEEGNTLPCVVFTSVMQNKTLTRLNVGELYLDVKQGLDDRKALVIMISGQSCPACSILIDGFNEHMQELEEVAFMVGLNKGEPALDIVYDIYEVHEILVNQEGWPAQWPVTNDVEDYYLGFESFPWIQVVRLSDMQVISLSNSRYSGANVDDLVAAIQSFE